MNRKEAGYAITGMLGAIVAGCSSQVGSVGTMLSAPRSTPPPGDEYSPIPIALFLSDSPGTLSLFKRPDNIRVSTSIDRILRIVHSPGYVSLRPLDKGQCYVYVKDTTTHAESQFDVDVGHCKNGGCSEAHYARDGAQDIPKLGLFDLSLLVGSTNRFKKSQLYTATAADPSICAVTDTGDRMDVQILARGGSKVVLTNTATGDESSFHVRAG